MHLAKVHIGPNESAFNVDHLHVTLLIPNLRNSFVHLGVPTWIFEVYSATPQSRLRNKGVQARRKGGKKLAGNVQSTLE
jgi:hypothetical protein